MEGLGSKLSEEADFRGGREERGYFEREGAESVVSGFV